MVGARRAGRLGAGAGGRDVLAAGARALGLLHRLRQTTHASSPEMRLCERRAGDSAGRGRRRRGARGDAQRAGNDHRASPGPRKPRDASPRRRLDGHGLGGHDANRRDRRRRAAGCGGGSGVGARALDGAGLLACGVCRAAHQYTNRTQLRFLPVSPSTPESEKNHCAIAWPVGVRPLPPYTEAPNGAPKDG